MKKWMLICISCLCWVSRVFAQDFASIREYSFGAKEDYKKAEEKVLECSHYLTTTPLKKPDPNRLCAVQFLLRWMEGTPDYNFMLDEMAIKLSKTNNDLLGVYVAGMANYAIQHPNEARDTRVLQFQAIDALLDYCKKSDNNAKPDKELRQMMAAKNKGKLKEYLKL